MPELAAPWVGPVRQRLRAWRAGRLLAGRLPPVLLTETGVVPRWYIPPRCRMAQPGPGPARTTCQHNGEATYSRVRNSDVRIWTYRHPDP